MDDCFSIPLLCGGTPAFSRQGIGNKTFPCGIYVVPSITGKGCHLILRSFQITVISQISCTGLHLYLRTVTGPSSEVIVADLIISSSLAF
jgi:hypothetical protein